MKLAQHIKIGENILNKISTASKKDIKIHKVAYLFGCIAPDLNCVYPPHRLVNTEKRFYNKLLRVSNTSNNLIKSFTLGVITHYICDYFCYAHNIKSLGIKHRKYENNLFKYYKEHINELENSYENIKDILKENTQKILLTNKDKHFELILEQIKYMNNYYMKKAGTLIDNNWIYKLTQLQLDNQFSTFMVEYVTFNII